MNNYNTTLEEVKLRADIVDIISEHVTLKKAGRNWLGLCPFHPEKTPSFTVNKDKGLFKCFGCGAGGDVFGFLQRKTGQSFSQVLVELANRYNIKVEFSTENQDLKNRIIEVNKLATTFYTETLLNNTTGAGAKAYLNGRNITDEIILNFNLGYVPTGWDNLISHLTKKHNIPVDLIEQAGLAIRKEETGSYYDRFRDRVIIPIHNERGQIIAFGGRALSNDNPPKYLNSPETMVFSKGKNLYGLFQAKESIRSEDSVILMEGYFDAISAHAHGITNAVATLGTALTSDQLRILTKYTDSKRIFMSFDADLAGGTATNRGIEVIKNTFGGINNLKTGNSANNNEQFFEVYVITVPDGKDPDDFLRKNGTDAFKKLIQTAPQLIDYQINQAIKGHNLDTTQGKVTAVREIAAILAEISNPILNSEYIKYASDRIDVREEDFRNEISRLKGKTRSTAYQTTDTFSSYLVKKEPKDFILTAERNLLSLFFTGEEYWTIVNRSLKEVHFTDADHQLIISSIEKLLKESTTIEALTSKILLDLSGNDRAMNILSDILFNLEDKKCLDNENKINLFIKENQACIRRFAEQNTENELRKRYYAAKDDEVNSLAIQYEVKQIVNSRLSAL